MLDSLITELNKEIRKKYRYYSGSMMIHDGIMALFILKYYCDIGKLNYKDIIKLDKIDKIKLPDKPFRIDKHVIYNHKILAMIEYEDLSELVKEYILNRGIGIDYLDNNDKKICIANKIDKEIYDINGNTTYLVGKLNISKGAYNDFIFYDTVLGLNNKYLTYDKIKKKDYKYLFAYDGLPKYRFIKDDRQQLYGLMYSVSVVNKNIDMILKTSFKKISNMNDTRVIFEYLDKIILYDDDNTFIHFKRDNSKIVSIINYDRKLIKTNKELYKIITDNKEIKDILVKTDIDTIEVNHYRIGFKLYQEGLKEKTRNIYEIVDENTRLIERLSMLDKDIAFELDILINR